MGGAAGSRTLFAHWALIARASGRGECDSPRPLTWMLCHFLAMPTEALIVRETGTDERCSLTT